MLDEKTEMMLSVANLLTAEELDQIRASAPEIVTAQVPAVTSDIAEDHTSETDSTLPVESDHSVQPSCTASRARSSRHTGTAQGEIERRRTRESKIATECVGRERAKHEWWPVGTELVGRIGAVVFTAVVITNPQVKSGRSIRITSGAADGQVCRTPTRAALEATEAYRQANNLGRGGGVTNGWEFWKARA